MDSSGVQSNDQEYEIPLFYTWKLFTLVKKFDSHRLWIRQKQDFDQRKIKLSLNHKHFKDPIVGLIKRKIVLGTKLLKLIWRENRWHKINFVISKKFGYYKQVVATQKGERALRATLF
jgi:hypothetical protein